MNKYVVITNDWKHGRRYWYIEDNTEERALGRVYLSPVGLAKIDIDIKPLIDFDETERERKKMNYQGGKDE